MIKFDHINNNKAWIRFLNNHDPDRHSSISSIEEWNIEINLKLEKYSAKYIIKHIASDCNLYFENEEGYIKFLLEWI